MDVGKPTVVPCSGRHRSVLRALRHRPGRSANCVVVEARRAERVWFAACVVLATTRADVNGIVRKPRPIGLPADWQILIDQNVIDQQYVVIGSGIRGSKLLAAT